MIIFTTLFTQAISLNSSYYETCKPQTCGNGQNITYPFWLSNQQEPYCGYPTFKLTCKNKNPVISISNFDYTIKHINYSNQSFLLTNSDILQDECHLPLHNFSLNNHTPFTQSSRNSDFSFFYNCSSKPSGDFVTYPIACASNSTSHSFATVHKEVLMYTNMSLFESCGSLVDVPMDYYGAAGGMASMLKMSYVDVLKLGFVLDWSAHDCGDCERSGGRCGFNKNEVVCFCRDRSHGKTCDDGSKVNWKLKVVVGVCSAIGTVAIIFVIFFIRKRRNRNRYGPSSSYASRSLFSKSYSKSKSDVENKASAYLGVHIFTYKELEHATNYFDSSRELGDGGFCTVYYGKLKDGRSVAVKRLYETNYKRVEQFMNEIEIIARLRHQNLVLLYGCTSRHSRELLLVYEYVPNGTLADHLHGGKANSRGAMLPWHTRIHIAVETASALSYLHASEIIHRDVKTTNILLDNNFCVKVADFGLSRLFPTDVTHISTAPQGTPGYVDPDYNQCYQLTTKSDVYSFGVVLAELISSLPAVDVTRHRHEINLSNMAIEKIQKRKLDELVDKSLGYEEDFRVRRMVDAVAELAFRCLQNEKDLRPSMMEVEVELRRIKGEDFGEEKAEEIDITGDDVVLPTSGPLATSPDL